MVYAARHPKRRFHRRRRARRAYRGSRATRVNTATFKGPYGIPDRIIAKYPYAQTFTQTAGITVANSYFRNSMQDPDYSGGGHQPFMRDQIADLFGRYRCYGFKYEIFIQNTDANRTVRWCVIPFNHVGTNTMDTLWEKPYTKHGLLTPDTGGHSIVRVSGFVSAARVLGMTKKEFETSDDTDAVTGLSPTREAFLGIFTQASDAISSVTSRVTVRLTMYTKYFDRKPIPAS